MRFGTRSRALALTSCVFLVTCGPTVQAPEHEPANAVGASETETHPQSTEAASRVSTLGHIRVVDLEGRMLPGMLPIVTTEPNAFNEPVATGLPTDSDGISAVQIPADRAYYLRAWDPRLRLFANNFFTVHPDSEPETEILEVVMVPAAALALVLLDKNGIPPVDQPVELMLIHPTHGPWWPARAVTDDSGAAVFTNLPPGQFGAQLSAGDAGSTGMETLVLPPGESTNAGVVTLQ